ncbi:unnamed protein product [Rhodiola kirilowii]
MDASSATAKAFKSTTIFSYLPSPNLRKLTSSISHPRICKSIKCIQSSSPDSYIHPKPNSRNPSSSSSVSNFTCRAVASPANAADIRDRGEQATASGGGVSVAEGASGESETPVALRGAVTGVSAVEQGGCE